MGQKLCFIFGFDGRSDRPDPLHLTVYIPIAWAEIPVRIEQIYLDSPDSSLPQWCWSVTISRVSLLKQRVNLADDFPFLAAGRKAGFTAQTSLHQWMEWKMYWEIKMCLSPRLLLPIQGSSSPRQQRAAQRGQSKFAGSD